MTACKIRKDDNYWREKLAAFLHDPPDKALSIWGHVKRAETLRGELYVTADENLVSRADQVASGLDRTFLPEKEDGGKIDFPIHPQITHPTGKVKPLDIGPLQTLALEEIVKLISKDETELPHTQPHRAFALFHYFRHVLPWRLAWENVGGLSWRWAYLPADTRLPDHSIWQHCALTSALYSCYRESPSRQASLMVFSLTPVQDFIARSRKLRDYWTASLILSWLAAEGMKAVIFHYGSDHIVYPHPVGQALIETRLDKVCGFRKWSNRYTFEAQAATLPNRFVFLVPEGNEEEASLLIKDTIKRAWLSLARQVQDLVKDKAFHQVPEDCVKAFERIFTRQTARFWEFHWAAASLLNEDLVNEYVKLFPVEIAKKLTNILEKARKCELPYLSYTEKFFYPLTHDLIGRGLAAEKLSPVDQRAEEPGIKCHLHPDLEALRFSCRECKKQGQTVCKVFADHKPDENPRPSRDPCWRKIRKAFPATEFKETERLSAIGLIKRLAHLVNYDEEHPLAQFFDKAESFPSTTEMALSDWLARARDEMQALDLTQRQVAEMIHREESPETEYNEIEEIDKQEIKDKVKRLIKRREKAGDKLKIVDRYYALLIMDGDHMGKLLAGGFAARWRDTLHPELLKRFDEGQISERFRRFWKDLFEEKRTLSPATHAAISRALSEFALCTVPYLVRKYKGRLIYAGGDDVCAVFPVSSAIDAALEIARAYNWAFVRYGKPCQPSTSREHPNDNWLTEEVFAAKDLKPGDRLLIHLGQGSAEVPISISAGLLLVHHKWPLRAALRRAHELLDLAKDSGRAALALELQRRAGERRTFVAGFRDTLKFPGREIPLWEAFGEVVQVFSSRKLSSSFAYRLKELEDGFRALHFITEAVARFVLAQMKGFEKGDLSVLEELSLYLSSVLLGDRRKNEEGEMQLAFDAIDMANFFGEAARS